METLYTCPRCQQPGFLLRGLKAHRCPVNGGRPLDTSEITQMIITDNTPLNPDTTSNTNNEDTNEATHTLVPDSISPATTGSPIDGGWTAVRRYADAAIKFTRCALACQVLAGFELLELHKQHNVKRGQPALGTKKDAWEVVVRREVGISDDTARGWMNMATAVKPKLKKLEGFEGIASIIDVPISQLSAPQIKLLEQGTAKLTDGKTQLEFMWELGVAKKPQGSAATGGDTSAHRKNPTPEEARQLQIKLAAEDWRSLNLSLIGYGMHFALLQDFEVEAQIHLLEIQLQARRKWLSTPISRRNYEDAEAQLSAAIRSPSPSTTNVVISPSILR